jgi:hypothetical protein
MNRRTLLTIVFVVAIAALPAAAKPNFSGSWKLDADRSDFGPQPPPSKMNRTIKHADPELSYTTSQDGPQGEMTTETKVSTDGKEFTNQMMGMDIKGTATWEGDVLKISNKLDLGGNEVLIEEKWSLSEDGNTLTSNLLIKSPQGDFEMKIVMLKQ